MPNPTTSLKNKKLFQLLVPLALAIAIIVFILTFSNFSRISELKIYDLKMQLTAKLRDQDRPIAEKIKIVNITDSTIKKMGWPQQADHARIIDILSQHQAAQIAYNWIFHEPQSTLVQAVKNSGRTLWPVLFDLSPNKGYEKYPRSVSDILDKSSIKENKYFKHLWHTTTATTSLPNLLQHSQGMGHISARNEEGNPQSDGVYRKVALLVDYAGQLFPSLALQVACNYLQVPINKIKITHRKIIIPQARFPGTGKIKDIRIPINKHGEMWIYFPGRWEENYFEPFWFENLLDKHGDQSRWPEYDRKFQHNICFVGNASGKNKDTHTIPIEDNYPGVGIQAAALFTILSGNFIRFPGRWAEVLIILLMGLSVGAISRHTPPLTVSTAHLALLGGYVALTIFVFGKYRISLPTTFPAATILIGAIASVIFHFAWERAILHGELVQSNAELSLKNQELVELLNKLTKSENLRVEFEQLSFTDGLIGIPNRRRLDMRFKEELSRSQRHRFSMGCLMIDIDHFKKFNDTYGHAAGDYVLREIGTILNEMKRDYEIVGRYGGEELAIILTQINKKDAYSVADRFRAKIENHPFNFEGQKLNVTVSIGVTALIPTEKDTMESIYEKADKALYKAKKGGRNRCVLV
jgi:diguanylate cyclase (GGDEF)-like protein